MMSETPNRAAADLLPPDLLPEASREAFLGSPVPAMILAADGSVLFASHAFARRLGFSDGAALMAGGLPRLTPGTLRLQALAAAMPDASRHERLRFVVGQRPALIGTNVTRLALGHEREGLLVQLSEAPVLLQDAPLAVTAMADSPAATVAEASPVVAAPAAPPPNRFVFTLSPDGLIETLSPAFHEALGGDPGMFLGQDIAQLAGALEPNAGAAIEKAVAAGTTWGGIRFNWPLRNGHSLVPVVLSAMPQHGPEGLKGFSGFGRILFDQSVELREADAPVGTQDHLPTPDAPRPEEVPEAPSAVVEASHDIAVSPAESEAIAPTGCSAADLERALTAFADDDAEAIELPRASEKSGANDKPRASEEPGANKISEVPAPAFEAEPPSSTSVQDIAHQNEALPPLTPEVAAPPTGTEQDNVVSLRPGAVDLPSGLPPHLARPGLSMSERNAFREIARALGAKFEAEEPSPPESRTDLTSASEPEGEVQNDLFNVVGIGTAKPQASHQEEPPLREAEPAPPVEEREDTAEEEISLVDALPIGVLVLRGEEPLFANRTLLDLAGYPSFTGFIAAGGAQALFRKGTLPRETEEGFETVVLTTRMGEMVPVDAHLQIVAWDGAPASLIAFRRAVELEQGKALKSVAQDLKRVRTETAELRAVLDTATDGVLTLDETGAILSLNHAAEALFGLHQNEVAGSSFVQLLHNESHAAVLDYFEGLKANGVRSVLNDGREVAGREKKGGRIPLFLTFGRISDDEPRRFCAVLRDLTSWKRAETELTEARKSAEMASAKKSDFLAKVGHEIRTPMNAIIGFAEVMQEERLGPIGNAKYKEYLGDIRSSGLHVVSLVNDLLDLSKIEAGRMELNFNATDINAVVTGCVGLIQPQATQHRVLVRSQLAGKLPPVVADERSIRQILLNLLSNATRFTPAGGQVLVATVLQETGEAIIRIRDTGVGMSPTEIEQALESYRQVGAKRESGGTGLGLPLSKALAEANRANFSIRSAPGEGTTVEISFPPTRVLAE